jgi:hypothetical protein
MGTFQKVREHTPVARVHPHQRKHQANRTPLMTNGGTIPISLHNLNNPNPNNSSKAISAVPVADSQTGIAMKPILFKHRNIGCPHLHFKTHTRLMRSICRRGAGGQHPGSNDDEKMSLLDVENYGRQPRVLKVCVCFICFPFFHSLLLTSLHPFSAFMLFLTFFGSVIFVSRSRTSNWVYHTTHHTPHHRWGPRYRKGSTHHHYHQANSTLPLLTGVQSRCCSIATPTAAARLHRPCEWRILGWPWPRSRSDLSAT